jgi:hypothetical protein
MKRIIQKVIMEINYNNLDYWKNEIPDISLFPKLDLDVELFKRNNMAIADLIILSSLIKGDTELQNEILKEIKPEYLGLKLFTSYLYSIIKDELERYGIVNIANLKEKIPEHEPIIYGTPSDKRTLKGDYFTFYQILYLNPSLPHVKKSIDMVKKRAVDRGRE